MPHIVFVSSAMLCTELPDGHWCAELAPEDCGGLVPICSCGRLADVQRAAFAEASATCQTCPRGASSGAMLRALEALRCIKMV